MLKFQFPRLASDWLRDCNSFLLSAICHLAVLVLLGLLTMSSDRGWADVKLLAQMSESYDAPAGDVSLDDDLAKFTTQADDAASAAGPTTVFDSSSITVTDLSTVESPLDVLHTGGGLDGMAIGSGGDAALAGGTGGGGAEFFGIGGYGGTFVYVVDMSGSMSESGKWERAREELLRSIENLKEDQRFFVTFYNDGWYPMDADEPVLATAKQQDKLRRWVRQVWPSGGTQPLHALQHALKLQPDAIYFLSDGKFDPAVIDTLRTQNAESAGKIPIHTIAFVSTETIGIMKSIARNSGGKFRFVE